MPTSFMSAPTGSAAPIENSPPGIQIIPTGAGPGGAGAFGTVGSNASALERGVSSPFGSALNDDAEASTDANIATRTAMTAGIEVMTSAIQIHFGTLTREAGRLRDWLIRGVRFMPAPSCLTRRGVRSGPRSCIRAADAHVAFPENRPEPRLSAECVNLCGPNERLTSVIGCSRDRGSVAEDPAVTRAAGSASASQQPPSPTVPTSAAADDPLPPATSPYDALPEGLASVLDAPFTGDLDALVKRRLIRVGTVFNRTHYFIDKGVQRGPPVLRHSEMQSHEGIVADLVVLTEHEHGWPHVWKAPGRVCSC